jgi:hypothetical protein
LTGDDRLRVARLIGACGPSAPPALRARIEAEIARTARRPRLLQRVVSSRTALAGALAAGLAAAIAGLLVAVPAGVGGPPSVIDVHALYERGPAGPPPPHQAGRPGVLAKRFEGITFPSWEAKFGWKAAGQRSDELGGRRTATVFYVHEGHTLAYTIVSGKPLEPPAGAQVRRAGGVVFYAFRHGGHDVVSFERAGRTCVLSGHVIHASTVLKLAAWRPPL